MEFESEIVKLPGKIDWPVFYVPSAFEETLGTRGRVNVKAKVDGADFQSTLLPCKNGHYMVYNQGMREHCGKTIGDTVHVSLEVDNQPREVELPADVLAVLSTSEGAMDKFASLPYYIKREEINKINSAKTQPTREKRILALVDKLEK